MVLPEPGGPQRIIECSSPLSIAARRTRPGPSRCSWPTISSSALRPHAVGERRRPAAAPRRAGRLLEQLHARLRLARRAAVQPGGQRRQVVEARDRLELPARHVRLVRPVGDEGHAGGLWRPRRPPRSRPRRARRWWRAVVRRDHAPAVGIGLERAHLVAGDHQVELVADPAGEALERDRRHLARVVGPHRGREAGRARALHRLARAGLAARRPPWPGARGRARPPRAALERRRPGLAQCISSPTR